MTLDHVKIDHQYLFIKSGVFCKPGNAFCYLQPDSCHAKHNSRGWIRGLLIRNLTRTNTIEQWREENLKLFRRLQARGHTYNFLLQIFKEIRWEHRSTCLQPKSRTGDQHNHSNLVVLSTPYSPGFDVIRRVQPLSFASFRRTALTASIFPPCGTWVARAPTKLGSILKRKY